MRHRLKHNFVFSLKSLLWSFLSDKNWFRHKLFDKCIHRVCKYLFIKTVPYYFWIFFIFFDTQGRHIIYKIFQNNLLTYSESAHVCFSSFSWCINLFTDFEDLSSHTNITDWETNFYFYFFAISADSRWT